MKPLQLKEVRRTLEQNNCACLRAGNHEIWKNFKTNQVFSLPADQRIVSPGVMRKCMRPWNGETK